MTSVEATLVTLLERWTAKHNIPDDHGMKHYLQVRANALAARTLATLTANQRLAVLLACLLHDVDDRKLKRSTLPLPEELAGVQPAYPVAYTFLQDVEVSAEIRNLVLAMIDLVAASKNGNRTHEPKWMLIPRDCDRLEALGEIGIQRCYEYTVRSGAPLVCPTTPLPCTEDELKKVLVTRTLEAYVASGGVSASMLDHYLDKLLNMHMGSGDPDLQVMAESKMAVMKANFFAYTRVFSKCELTAPLYGKP